MLFFMWPCPHVWLLPHGPEAGPLFETAAMAHPRATGTMASTMVAFSLDPRAIPAVLRPSSLAALPLAHPRPRVAPPHRPHPSPCLPSWCRGRCLLSDPCPMWRRHVPLPGHGECGGGSVTTLLWIDSAIGRVSATRSSSTLVATTSTGYILEWTLNITKQELQLKSGFMLQGQDVPRSIRTQIDESSGVGIATASFNSEDITLFVVGAEVGGMFLCSTTREVPTGVTFAGIGLKKCVTSVLAPHTGRVITAECSPHHRNAILSAASDNEIRLYSLLQPNRPVSVIYSEQNISCAHWSLSRPLVVAVGLTTGQVVLYDFGQKNCEPFLTLPAAEKPSPITTTAFNKKNMALIAVGDQLGRVSLWQLPNSAVSPTSTELSTLFTLLGNLTE
ncbi:cytoplasmic dynein 2 intermediate chain 2-like [Penaeus indicus]|uniref:cytoplasmic dynein 2 intermediate chain 2-like n=1 Tax=Penaeus indicus TaxID=29960 RepID=UPI00300D49EB